MKPQTMNGVSYPLAIILLSFLLLTFFSIISSMSITNEMYLCVFYCILHRNTMKLSSSSTTVSLSLISPL